MRVLIVEDGAGAYVLPVARSLARGGVSVGVATTGRTSRAQRSRWVSSCYALASPLTSLDLFAESVRAAATAGGFDAAFATDDVNVLALAAIRDVLPLRVMHPPVDVLIGASDKLAMTRTAALCGIPVPSTAEASMKVVDSVSLPVMVKARWHWLPGARTDDARFVPELCHERQQVRARVDRIEAAGSAALIQAPVWGALSAITVLLDESGRPVAASQQRALSTSPTSGTSTRAETVVVDPCLLQRTVDMLHRLNLTGLVNLQFLQPPGSEPLLIDLNPRCYGSIALAIAAGMDFPLWWVRRESAPTHQPAYAPPGVRYQSLEQDLRRVLSTERHPLRASLSSVSYAIGAAHSTWSLDDPLPAVQQTAAIARRRARRRTRTRIDRVSCSTAPG